MKKYTYKSENILITPFYTNNNHAKKHTYKTYTPNIHINLIHTEK